MMRLLTAARKSSHSSTNRAVSSGEELKLFNRRQHSDASYQHRSGASLSP